MAATKTSPSSDQSPQTAAERLPSARNEEAALKAEQPRLNADFTRALVDGQNTTSLNERREAVAQRLDELALIISELERRTEIEKRVQLKSDLAAAFVRQSELNARIKDKTKEVEAAEAAWGQLAKELDKMKVMTGGVYSANERLAHHRAAHPWIVEEDI